MAIDFLGTDEYVSVALDDPTVMTMALWVNLDDATARGICARNNGTLAAYAHSIGVNSSGQAFSYMFDTDSRTAVGTTVLVAGTWYHLTMTAVNNGALTISVNGAQEGSTNIATMWTGGDRYWFGWGGDSGATTYCDGRLEDVRIYHRILSANEVATLAAGFRGPLGGEVLWLPMDDFSEPFYSSGALSSVAGAAKSRIYDRSGNGNHAACSGAPEIQPVVNAPWTNPNGSTTLDYAIDFLGTDEFLNCWSSAGLDNIAELSIAAWIYVDDVTGNDNIVHKGAANHWAFFASSVAPGNNTLGFFSAWTGNAMWKSSASSLSTGVWVHVGITHTRASSTVDPIFYRNGVALTTTENNAPTGNPPDDSANNLTVGLDGYFDGRMEDIRVFNRILSAAEMALLAGGNVGKLGGEVVWLSASRRQGKGQFDGVPLNADNIVPDYSGNGNVGTPSGQPTGQASYAPRSQGWIP